MTEQTRDDRTYIPEYDYYTREYKPFKEAPSNDMCGRCEAYYEMLYEKGLTKTRFPPSCERHVLERLTNISEEDFKSEEEFLEAQVVLDPIAWAYSEFGWEPRWYQSEMLQCTSQKKLYRCGRRTGKTTEMIIEILYEIATNEERTVLVIAPFERQITHIFDEMNKLINKSVSLKGSIKRQTKSPSRIEFKNGSKVLGFSAGAGQGSGSVKIRGQDAHMIVIDEIDYLEDPDVDAVLAILASHPNCKLIAATTPAGWRKRFYTYVTQKDAGFKEFWFISAESPNWGEQEEQFFRATTDEARFSHEYLADFAESEDGVFKADYINKSIYNYEMAEIKPDMSNDYILGVDWNKSAGTHMVIIEQIGHTLRLAKKIVVPESEYMQTDSVDIIIRLNDMWRFKHIFVDAGYGCLDPETLVTTDNGFKYLKDINVGDLVLNSLGKYEKVLHKETDIKKPAFTISARKIPKITLSNCHPSYVATLPNRFKTAVKNITYSWRLPEEINTNTDFLVIPKENKKYKDLYTLDLSKYITDANTHYDSQYIWSNNSYTINPKLSNKCIQQKLGTSRSTIQRTFQNIKKNKKLTKSQQQVALLASPPACTKYSRFIPFDEEFQKLLGWYLAEGSVSGKTVELSQKKLKYMQEFLKLYATAKKYFPNSRLLTKTDGTKRLIISGKIPSQLFAALGGKGAKNKRLHKDLQDIRIPGVLQGLYYGDGHNRKNETLQLSLTSFKLTEQIRQYFINHNILPSLYIRKANRVKHNDKLRIDISGNSIVNAQCNKLFNLSLLNTKSRVNRNNFIVHNNNLLVPINKVSKVEDKHDFIDIEVSGNHTFCANGAVTHNSVQHELLRKHGLKNRSSKLDTIVHAIHMNQYLDVLDPISNLPVKKFAKPFLVDSTKKLLEDGFLQLPKSEDTTVSVDNTQMGLIQQMRNFRVESYSVYGLPRYSQGEEHTLTAYLLAIGGFFLKEGALAGSPYAVIVRGITVDGNQQKVPSASEKEYDDMINSGHIHVRGQARQKGLSNNPTSRAISVDRAFSRKGLGRLRTDHQQRKNTPLSPKRDMTPYNRRNI